MRIDVSNDNFDPKRGEGDHRVQPKSYPYYAARLSSNDSIDK